MESQTSATTTAAATLSTLLSTHTAQVADLPFHTTTATTTTTTAAATITPYWI